MFKYLLVGDIHSTSNKLDEVNKLFELIYTTAIRNNIFNIILTGDLFDTHQSVNLVVMHNYARLFKKYDDLYFICYPGNHDIPLHGNRLHHALLPFVKMANVLVLDASEGLDHYDGIDYVPYCTEEEFFKLTQNPTSDTLVCHQTFLGAAFETGFYAKDGIDLSRVPYKRVVSGHIHTTQSVGKCFYPGAPRWFKTSDANQDKCIWLWDGADEYKPISTVDVCQSIIKLTLTDKDAEPDLTNPNKRYILEISGTSKFISKMTKKYGGLAEITSNLDSNTDYEVKESVGITQALENFILTQYRPQFGIGNEQLLQEIRSRING